MRDWPKERRGKELRRVRGDVYKNMQQPAAEFPDWPPKNEPGKEKCRAKNDQAVTYIIEVVGELEDWDPLFQDACGRGLGSGNLSERYITRKHSERDHEEWNCESKKIGENAPEGRVPNVQWPADQARALGFRLFPEPQIYGARGSGRPEPMRENIHTLHYMLSFQLKS